MQCCGYCYGEAVVNGSGWGELSYLLHWNMWSLWKKDAGFCTFLRLVGAVSWTPWAAVWAAGAEEETLPSKDITLCTGIEQRALLIRTVNTI